MSSSEYMVSRNSSEERFQKTNLIAEFGDRKEMFFKSTQNTIINWLWSVDNRRLRPAHNMMSRQHTD